MQCVELPLRKLLLRIVCPLSPSSCAVMSCSVLLREVSTHTLIVCCRRSRLQDARRSEPGTRIAQSILRGSSATTVASACRRKQQHVGCGQQASSEQGLKQS